MRIMTFNLRFATPVDGPDEWRHRKELVLETIWARLPDLLGTQEGTVPMLDYLADHLTGYAPFTAHREVDPTCQYPTIFYRPDKVVAGPGEEFWLSQTPGVHRSKSWDSAFPRMVTFGCFREVNRDLWFYFADTHLDHISVEARRQGALMLRRHFEELASPAILVGDFNDAPGSEVHRILTTDGSPFQDSWETLGLAEDATTQHSFAGERFGNRIDWILTTEPFRVRRAEIITYDQAGRYPSDHFPYVAEVEY